MASKDLSYLLDEAVSLAPAVRDSDTDGAGVDLLNYEGALVMVSVGAEGVTLSGTDKITLELEHSDDDLEYTDCAAADTVGEESAGVIKTVDAGAEAPATYSVSYVGGKRYVRPVLNFAGTHGTGTPTAAHVIRAFRRHSS